MPNWWTGSTYPGCSEYVYSEISGMVVVWLLCVGYDQKTVMSMVFFRD